MANGKAKRVLIIGGGYAGVEAAHRLEKRARQDDLQITLVDKKPYHTLMTELHEVAGGRVEENAVRVPFESLFPNGKVKVVLDRVEKIDFTANVARSREHEYPYDYVVLASGGEPETFNLPGVAEHSFTLWSMEDATKLRDHIRDVYHRASKETDPNKRRALLTFVVAGAGFTGVEIIGELIEWRAKLCRQYGIPRQEVRILLVEALPSVLPILPPKLQARATRYLQRHGTQIMLRKAIVECKPGEVSFADGEVLKSDTVVWTCGVQGCEFAANLDLTKGRCTNPHCEIAKAKGTCGVRDCQYVSRYAIETRHVNGKRGRLLANEYMQSVDYPNVYLIGDNMYYVENGQEFKNSKPVPQIVETAIQTAEVAVRNILADLRGHEKHKFRSNYHGHMVSIGSSYAVAHLVGVSLWGIPAMAMKHLINIHYLWGVGGLNTVWSYVRDQFFEIPDRRSIIGGLASAKAGAFWLVPLRLFLGVKWLIEGVNKILGGWLDPANIKIVPVAGVSGASAAEGAAQAGQAAADAVSAATGAAASGGAAASYAAPILAQPLGIYTWAVDHIISLFPFVFQAGVVLAETAIGLALIGGLFTFPAAAVSLVLCVMFAISAMAGWEILWYFFAAIAIMGGAGRTLSLDYWFMPWLKHWWSRTTIARRTHLYVD
jgi:NADH:ubiquinone reductase (H+-translocating)